MRRIILTSLLMWTGCLMGQTKSFKQGEYTFVGPFQHRNLAIYLIKGKATLPDDAKIIAIDEAMEKKILTVHETGNVNRLSVENTSGDLTVFIQAGDIVKGGKQDRVLAVDLLVKPRSGKIAIDSFCVESGRWAQRGGEERRKFSSSKKRAIGKSMRNSYRSGTANQSAVWRDVAKNQVQLSRKLNKNVRDARSATSMQLTLEDKDLEKLVKEYKTAFGDVRKKVPGAIGYAFLVNAEFSSCDVYANSTLFGKVWDRMLEACVTEAIADKTGKKTKPLPEMGKWINSLFTDGHVQSTRRRIAEKQEIHRRENKSIIDNSTLLDGARLHRSFDLKAK